MSSWDVGFRKDSFKVGSVFFDVVRDFFEVGSKVGICSVFRGRCPEAVPDVPAVFGRPLRKASGSRAPFTGGFSERPPALGARGHDSKFGQFCLYS